MKITFGNAVKMLRVSLQKSDSLSSLIGQEPKASIKDLVQKKRRRRGRGDMGTTKTLSSAATDRKRTQGNTYRAA